ncbi:HIT family protein [Solicola sp. PLA-1-18]|uniref:HIT family protein n=1 Tax=Solicola sp. PLA-1-18 TaxID=3380532 RepID=UPI003B82877C
MTTPPRELADDPMFPWTLGLETKPLDEPVVPEPVRAGEDGGCWACERDDSAYLWSDERWRVAAIDHVPLRGAVILESRAHVDSFADMPDDLAADLGRVTARVERAILGIGDVGRVHVVRWGDGLAHFHQWFLPRPLGAMQMRGQTLMFWIEALPTLDHAVRDEAHAAVAAALGRTSA